MRACENVGLVALEDARTPERALRAGVPREQRAIAGAVVS
jgi:hypothetical protein